MGELDVLLERLGLPVTTLGSLSDAGRAVLSSAVTHLEELTAGDLTVFRRLFDAEDNRRSRIHGAALILRQTVEQYERAGGDMRALRDELCHLFPEPEPVSVPGTDLILLGDADE